MVNSSFTTKKGELFPFDSVVVVDLNAVWHDGINVHLVFNNIIKLDKDEAQIFMKQYTDYLTQDGGVES